MNKIHGVFTWQELLDLRAIVGPLKKAGPGQYYMDHYRFGFISFSGVGPHDEEESLWYVAADLAGGEAVLDLREALEVMAEIDEEEANKPGEQKAN